MVIPDQTPRTALQQRCTLPVNRSRIVPNWKVRHRSLHESTEENELKFPPVLFFKKLQSLLYNCLYMYMYYSITTLYIHLYMLHRYWLSFIEGKIFISFFYIHKRVHLFCSIWKNLCSMWKALHGLPKWNICPQRRVYLPLGKSMEEEKYDHISL